MKDNKRKFPWKAVIAAAVCLCLILTAVFAMGKNKDDALNYGQVSYLSGNSRIDPVIYGEPSVTLPVRKIPIPESRQKHARLPLSSSRVTSMWWRKPSPS